MHTKSPPHSEEALIRKAASNPSTFARLYQQNVGRVYRYHLSRTGNVPDAQDLTALTFTAALEGIAGYSGRGSFCAWLFGIAHHLLAQHYRSDKGEYPLEDALGLPDPAPSTEAIADQHLEVSQILQVLRSLLPERAEALSLCVLADLSAAEAGQVMGKSEAAVKMLVFRGIRDLREKCALALQEEV